MSRMGVIATINGNIHSIFVPKRNRRTRKKEKKLKQQRFLGVWWLHVHCIYFFSSAVGSITYNRAGQVITPDSFLLTFTFGFIKSFPKSIVVPSLYCIQGIDLEVYIYCFFSIKLAT